MTSGGSCSRGAAKPMGLVPNSPRRPPHGRHPSPHRHRDRRRPRPGRRHVLDSFDAETESFSGTAQNVTSDVLCDERVEVHLNNGKELGPTEPQDLAADETVQFELLVEDAHAGEEGEGEHGDGVND